MFANFSEGAGGQVRLGRAGVTAGRWAAVMGFALGLLGALAPAAPPQPLGAQITAGGSHSLVLRTDGTVWAWGSNSTGELGDGTTDSRAGSVRVSGLAGVAAVAGGQWHSLALKSDGTGWAWGRN